MQLDRAVLNMVFAQAAAVALLLVTMLVYAAFEIKELRAEVQDLREANNRFANEFVEVMGYVGEEEQEDVEVLALVSQESFLKRKHSLSRVDQEQLDTLIDIYKRASHTDYALTLVSIAWQESRGSSWPVNLQDPSCGPFHNKVTNVMTREDIRDTPLNRNIVCGRLINDLDFAIKHAMLEIQVWERKHGSKNWRAILASYNGGHRGNPEYANNVAEIFRVFRSSNFIEIAGI